MAKIRMIGVPLDFGASRRGVDMGPAAIRVAEMAESLRALGHEVTDVGDISVPQRATRKLNAPPRIAMVRLSVRTCLTSRDRRAPSDTRTASS